LRDAGRAESRDLQFEEFVPRRAASCRAWPRTIFGRAWLQPCRTKTCFGAGSDEAQLVLPLPSCSRLRKLFCDPIASLMRLLLDHGKTIEFHGPADITKETTDAIVNAANSSLMGGGGVDGAIHRAGGPAILAECKKIVAEIGRLPAGKAVITTGGRLTARYVIHTVGPVYSRGKRGEAETLASCHRECIRLADEHALKSLAFPAISTGAYGYPVADAAAVAVSAVVDALPSTTHLTTVRFVLFDLSTLRVYSSAAEKLRDSNTGLRHRIDKSPT
jgi:O-acetyl-ADP-ribose deacetylase